jgi:hypothetical protein
MQKAPTSLTFCAMGAHRQNRIAEQFIGTITQCARTILLQAMAKWPSIITEEMWPIIFPYGKESPSAHMRHSLDKHLVGQ